MTVVYQGGQSMPSYGSAAYNAVANSAANRSSTVSAAPTYTGGGGAVSYSAPAYSAPAPAKVATVKSGDTLSKIASKNGITTSQLIALNPQITNPNLIIPGQVVNLSSGGGSGAVASNASTQLYNPTTGQYATPNANTTQAQIDYALSIGWQTATPQQTTDKQAEVDAAYKEAVAKNPAVSSLVKGGSTLEQIISALESGNLSGIYDSAGMPFSPADQQAALTQADADTKLYYEALQSKETSDAEAALAQKQSDYQNYLLTSGQNFEADKNTADQTAANQGVLFSGGRVQKEQNLARTYNQDQAYKQTTVGNDISSLAKDYQYKYGNTNAQGLSKYYNLGGNTYNPKVASGGVGSSSLSTMYNPSTYNYYGTQNVARKTAKNTAAAGLLWNKGNKLLASGYNNQYKS